MILPRSGRGSSPSLKRSSKSEDGHHGGHSRISNRKHEKDRRGKDRNRASKGNVQFRAADLQHGQTGNSVCQSAAGREDRGNQTGCPLCGTRKDKALAGRLEAEIKKITEEYYERKRFWRKSYQTRFHLFCNSLLEPSERKMVGFLNWYEERSLPMCHRVLDVESYFKPGEPTPCIMRGSIYGLRMKSRAFYGAPISYWTEKVFMRQVNWWLRKGRITCLDEKEWEGMVYKNFWKERADRIIRRYGCGRWSWSSELLGMVGERYDGEFGVIIDGKHVLVSKEKYDVLMEMKILERKVKRAK